MTVFLATLIIFSIVIALMSAAQLARRSGGQSDRCTMHCRGCTQETNHNERNTTRT
jgi:hypothetical protein